MGNTSWHLPLYEVVRLGMTSQRRLERLEFQLELLELEQASIRCPSVLLSMLWPPALVGAAHLPPADQIRPRAFHRLGLGVT